MLLSCSVYFVTNSARCWILTLWLVLAAVLIIAKYLIWKMYTEICIEVSQTVSNILRENRSMRSETQDMVLAFDVWAPELLSLSQYYGLNLIFLKEIYIVQWANSDQSLCVVQSIRPTEHVTVWYILLKKYYNFHSKPQDTTGYGARSACFSFKLPSVTCS